VLEDRYGLVVSTKSGAARDAYVEAVDAVLSANGDAGAELDRALAADPEFALAHAAYARVHQLDGRMAEARASAERGAHLAVGATERERSHTQVFALLTSGQGAAGLELIRAHVRDYPRDAFTLAPACSVFGLIGFGGRLEREAEQVALLEPLAPAYGDDWWFLTVYAFALIEAGEWKRGRAMVERALEQVPRSAHSAHVRAHALYEAGEDRVLADYLSDWLPGYAAINKLSCHLWWHMCLARLMLGEQDAIFDVYDAHCSPSASSSPAINVFTDGASLLWRAELAGMPRSHQRWRALQEFREAKFAQPMVFVDAHGALPALALGDNDALDAWHEALTQAHADGKLPAGTVPVQLLNAFGAHARGDWAGVAQTLEPLMPQVVRIGGSRAQRDLVQNTLLSAYINDGRMGAARALLRDQHDRAQTVPIPGLQL